VDAVAERAGVSKATIYRWWPSKETLALDALVEWADKGVSARDTGSLRGDLLALVGPWVEEVRNRSFERVMAALLTHVQTDAQFAENYRTHFLQPRREPMRAALQRAIERGEVRADVDLELAVDAIYGPLYHRLLNGHAPLDDHFAEAVVDMALGGITVRP
jgi:AcrR family transcriptional regulator